VSQAGSSWSRRASSLYNSAYAKRYRAHDEEFESSAPCREFADWLQRVCRACQPPLDVLDLGCGTGRYFWALSGVRELVGIDASPSMLAEAGRPYNAERITASSVSLIEDDMLDHRFEPARFDLVYSIGVLAEHTPLDEQIVGRVLEWLKPGGRFAFTTVHPASSSIPRTLGRQLGEWLAPVVPASIGRRLRARLLAGGLYADERRVRELVEPAFEVESLERFESEAHLHCLCVARKRIA
jgi:SAM-dependent methyltransferase